MWEGKALVFLDAPLQLLGFGFGLFSLFSSSPSTPDYTPYLDQVRSSWCIACLNMGFPSPFWSLLCLPLFLILVLLSCMQINQTTLETLDRVKSLQDQVTLMQAELVNIRNDIKDLKCSVETARLDTDTRAIQVRRWHGGVMRQEWNWERRSMSNTTSTHIHAPPFSC
jgi:hypothetical protein